MSGAHHSGPQGRPGPRRAWLAVGP